MATIQDPNLTLVTPTPLNLTRAPTPTVTPIVISENVDNERHNANDNRWKRIWIRLGRPFSGIIRDISTRLPYYISDWTDAYNYRIIPATAMVFFSK
jgi:hypothetical protein